MTVYIRVVIVPATNVEAECQSNWTDWLHTHSGEIRHNTWPVSSRFSSLDGLQSTIQFASSACRTRRLSWEKQPIPLHCDFNESI